MEFCGNFVLSGKRLYVQRAQVYTVSDFVLLQSWPAMAALHVLSIGGSSLLWMFRGEIWKMYVFQPTAP